MGTLMGTCFGLLSGIVLFSKVALQGAGVTQSGLLPDQDFFLPFMFGPLCKILFQG